MIDRIASLILAAGLLALPVTGQTASPPKQAASSSGKAAAKQPTRIELWHAMEGALADELNTLVARFNAEHKAYEIVPLYKGGYDETLALASAARLQGKGPHIVQAYDVATADLMNAKQLVKPVHELMRETRVKLDASIYAPAVSSFFSDSKGRLYALPFNQSTPVVYYNKDAFAKAGLDPETRFKSWYDVQEGLLKLREAGVTQCGLTTTWPSWVLVENTLSWHNEEFASKNNGFDGLDAKLTFNTRLAIRHISLLTTWLKSEIFSYAGRRDEGEPKFIRGDCAMLTGSSASYANIRRNASFQMGVMPMPYYDDISKDAPYNTTMGGAGLWALAGKKPDEYKGVATFFAWLARPEIQAEWHQKTGYLPVSKAAFDMTRKGGFYEKNPGADIPVQQIVGKAKPEAYSRGVRLGSYAKIRAILDEELEQAFILKKTPKQALDDAVDRGNELLRTFEKARR